MRNAVAVVIVFLVLVSAVARAADAPRIFQSNGEDLAAAKARAAKPDEGLKDALDEIRERADKALELKLVTVMDKSFTPSSGDKHDYMSLSPYWWPDKSKPDGKPYLRKDGEFNPDRAKYDLPHMEAQADAAEVLAMHYYFTGDEKYAKRSAEIMRAWFIAPATRMNPNCRYAQFIPGVEEENRAAGVIETNRLRDVVDADGLLAGSQHWSADDSKQLKAWFKEFLTYLIESEQGKKEQAAPNNHGTFWGVQAATYALYLDDTELAKKIIQKHGPGRIAKQIEPDGRQPEELERTKAFDYSRYNILAHEDLAMLGERVGVNVWAYQTDDGRSLRKAIDWMLPFMTGDAKWQYKQISDPKMKEAATVLRRAANAYNEPKYEQAIAKMKVGASDMTNLLFPAKTK
ncbi:MAG: alginate lyase family protein [Planctomycetota bacterium]|nr:alginate lyase family protein [Planctomycetota bacterium]